MVLLNRFFKRVVRKLLVRWRKISSRIYRLQANFHVWTAGGKLVLGRSIKFTMPVRIDGKGEVAIGNFCNLGYRLAPRFGKGEILIQAREPGTVIVLGEKCSFSNNISIVARTRIELGKRCLVGDRVTILDSDFHVVDPQIRKNGGGAGETQPVKIGANCWIGTDAMILKGVTIGDDSIVSPKSVVTKSFPARSVLAGVPAKLIKSLE